MGIFKNIFGRKKDTQTVETEQQFQQEQVALQQQTITKLDEENDPSYTLLKEEKATLAKLQQEEDYELELLAKIHEELKEIGSVVKRMDVIVDTFEHEVQDIADERNVDISEVTVDT